MLKIELIPFAFDGRVPTPNQGCSQDGSKSNSRFSRAGITQSIKKSIFVSWFCLSESVWLKEKGAVKLLQDFKKSDESH